MRSIHLESTIKTPELDFNGDTGVLMLSGRSLPEDAVDFYEAPLTWIKEYSEAPKPNTKAVFRLEYLNTSSSSMVRSLLEKLTELNRSGKSVVSVEWHFEEDDLEMEETGRHYEHTIEDLPIKFVEVESLD